MRRPRRDVDLSHERRRALLAEIWAVKWGLLAAPFIAAAVYYGAIRKAKPPPVAFEEVRTEFTGGYFDYRKEGTFRYWKLRLPDGTTRSLRAPTHLIAQDGDCFLIEFGVTADGKRGAMRQHTLRPCEEGTTKP